MIIYQREFTRETIYGKTSPSGGGLEIIIILSFSLLFSIFVSSITLVNRNTMYEFNPILHNIAMILLSLVSCIPPTFIMIQ